MDIFRSGYRIEEVVLSANECDFLLGTFADGPHAAGRAGKRHLMSNQSVKELAHDGRLLRIAQEALGVHGVPFRATLFAKSRSANWLIPWHQDTALPLVSEFTDQDWVSWSQKEGIHYAHAPAWALSRVVALRVHLDASGSENGPLRVVPGSHQLGVLTDQGVSDYVKTNDHNACLVPRGGVLAMRPLLIHSSSKASD
jgi:ectoine hydroxylase-related dioxygenase (phytanoyl-CoA dioxygenase family)